MGKPGAMLKTASTRFITNSHCRTIESGLDWERSVSSHQSRKKSPDRTRLVSGPTIAMANSCRGRRASAVIWETPPKINSEGETARDRHDPVQGDVVAEA
jgi:hypothetical protein